MTEGPTENAGGQPGRTKAAAYANAYYHAHREEISANHRRLRQEHHARALAKDREYATIRLDREGGRSRGPFDHTDRVAEMLAPLAPADKSGSKGRLSALTAFFRFYCSFAFRNPNTDVIEDFLNVTRATRFFQLPFFIKPFHFIFCIVAHGDLLHFSNIRCAN